MLPVLFNTMTPLDVISLGNVGARVKHWDLSRASDEIFDVAVGVGDSVTITVSVAVFSRVGIGGIPVGADSAIWQPAISSVAITILKYNIGFFIV